MLSLNNSWLDYTNPPHLRFGSTLFNDLTAGTISIWLYPTLNGYEEGTVYYATGFFSKDSVYCALHYTSTNAVRAYYYDGSPRNFDSSNSLNLNKWNHVVYAWDSTGSYLMVNGVVTTSALTWTNTHSAHINTNAFLGISHETYALTQGSKTYRFYGYITEFTYHTVKFTYGDAYSLYYRKEKKDPLNYRDLKCYLPLDDDPVHTLALSTSIPVKDLSAAHRNTITFYQVNGGDCKWFEDTFLYRVYKKISDLFVVSSISVDKILSLNGRYW